ncbi:regulatory protein GemA [Paracidovorax anthurii]|uniref:Phage gp16-like protein n=1 Tax=Paracidovorax anthurii TaxID=78229 RepID=A0A328ZUX2_9BURK|nr:regulatory protein GemA [Paracidovorax anthurii]RAR86066.1 phage gp16-like protein [Paracidovorax anthurii]
MADHTAAIHVLKSKLQFTDDDYRALIKGLTLKSSSKEMTDAERRQVRDHMQNLAERMGVVPTTTRRRPLTREQFAQTKAAASPRERKVWALWHQLHRDGLVDNPSRAALDAWVQRQVGVSSLRFASGAQLDTLIEALKAWQQRGAHG